MWYSENMEKTDLYKICGIMNKYYWKCYCARCLPSFMVEMADTISQKAIELRMVLNEKSK
jgi:hypothetical protein